jgi:hypothetical protein
MFMSRLLSNIVMAQVFSALFERCVVEGDRHPSGHGGLHDGFLECVAAIDTDAIAVQFSCHAHRRPQSGSVGMPRHMQHLAIVTHGGGAEAINNRALFGHAVLAGERG